MECGKKQVKSYKELGRASERPFRLGEVFFLGSLLVFCEGFFDMKVDANLIG